MDKWPWSMGASVWHKEPSQSHPRECQWSAARLVIYVPDFHHLPCILRGFIAGELQPVMCQLVRQQQIRGAKAVIPISSTAPQQKEEERFNQKLPFKVSNSRLQGKPWVQGKQEVGRRKVGNQPQLFVPAMKQRVQST